MRVKYYILCSLTDTMFFHLQCRSTSVGYHRVSTINGTCSAGQVINVTSVIIDSVVIWNVYANTSRCWMKSLCSNLLTSCNGHRNCSFNQNVPVKLC